MSEFDVLLEKLQAIKSQGWWEDVIPVDIWEEYFNDFVVVASGLDVATHRWYETSTTVIKILGRFIGINGVSNVFSENMGFEDCGVDINFFEMEEIASVTYKAK